jgi:hypothetical protein
MAYSPFDVSSLPDLADNINLEEELEKMNEKITGLEDVELNGNRGTIAGNGETTDKHNESDDSVLKLSLDSIIERVASQQHVTLEHASEAPTPSTGTQGKKRAHTETTEAPTGEGLEEIDVDGADESAERAGKRRRIETAGGGAEALHEKAAAATSDVAATLATEEASTTSSSSTAPTAVEEELELSWSWGDGVEEEETDTSLAPPKKVSPLMGEVRLKLPLHGYTHLELKAR